MDSEERRKIIDEIRFSYSSLSTFHTCKYSWYLTYIEKVSRAGNWWADYGTLIHQTMEKYFAEELETFELTDYVFENYEDIIQSKPSFLVKEDVYIADTKRFFDEFRFPRDDYEVKFIEDKIDVDLEYKLVVKPDLVLKEKATGKHILIDYKTSLIYKKGKLDEEKLTGYVYQMTMYSIFLRNIGIEIDEVWLWFIRDTGDKVFYKFIPTDELQREVDKWILDTITAIRNEEEFTPNINKFFCQNLCSVSKFCKHKPKK